jgi:hypothetical protein
MDQAARCIAARDITAGAVWLRAHPLQNAIHHRIGNHICALVMSQMLSVPPPLQSSSLAARGGSGMPQHLHLLKTNLRQH